MKKTLIALMLASLPVASMAEVVLYGKIKGGVEVTKTRGFDGTTTKIVDYGSRIGFKGQEEINSGLKAIWQVEQYVSIGGRKDQTFNSRDSFIGLSGDFGSVKAGYLGSPTHQHAGDLDWWDYDENSGGVGVIGRSNDATKRRVAVRYETGDMAGLKATAYVAPTNNMVDEVDMYRRSVDSSVYGAGVEYANSGFFARAAGTYVKNGENNQRTRSNGKRAHAYQVLAQTGFEKDDVLFGVGYQQSKNVDNYKNMTRLEYVPAVDANGNPTWLDAKEVKLHNVQEVAATAAYTFNDALTLKGSAGYGFNIKTSVGGEEVSTKGTYIQGAVGAEYKLSKRTQLNGQVGYLQFDKKERKFSKGTVGVGMAHKF